MISLPTYDEIILPLLRFVADGQEHTIRDVIDGLAAHYDLSEEERNAAMPNQKTSVFSYRAHWANTYLKKARLIESVGRGRLKITARGLDVLSANPMRIDREFLMQFPEFAEFSAPNNKTINSGGSKPHAMESTQTPEEQVHSVFRELDAKLADELLEYVLDSSPLFFERLVVDLLLAMGYGGSLGMGQNIGQSGDGGIDGYINEDKLGLDTIYIQAKRWAKHVVVGRPDVQAFVGSLMGTNGTKGVFITTSVFSKQAEDYARGLKGIKLILIDGNQLTQLMIEHNIGVSVYQTFIMKRVDSDYFSTY